MLKESGLTDTDLELMGIGESLDFVYHWIDFHNPKKKKDTVRLATQEDIDRMF